MIDMKKAASMGGDPADRKEASYWPEYEDNTEDLWADEWLELCRKDNVTVCPQAVTHGKTAVVSAIKRTDKDAHRLAQREAIVRFLQQAREVSQCPDLQYFVACWQAAFELEDRDEDKTQTAIAAQFQVTRAAVSKRVVEIRKAANPATIARSQKSIAARKVYALRQMIVGQTRKKIDLTSTQTKTLNLWTSTASN